jgi:hypothetical protein
MIVVGVPFTYFILTGFTRFLVWGSNNMNWNGKGKYSLWLTNFINKILVDINSGVVLVNDVFESEVSLFERYLIMLLCSLIYLGLISLLLYVIVLKVVLGFLIIFGL